MTVETTTASGSRRRGGRVTRSTPAGDVGDGPAEDGEEVPEGAHGDEGVRTTVTSTTTVLTPEAGGCGPG